MEKHNTGEGGKGASREFLGLGVSQIAAKNQYFTFRIFCSRVSLHEPSEVMR